MPNELDQMHADMDAYLNKGKAPAETSEVATPDNVTVEVPAAIEQAKTGAKKPKKTAVEAATALVPKVSDVPVPTGGVGLLLFIILLIVFAIMPAPGQDGLSRLSLVWKAFLGQASLGNTPASSGKKYTSSTPGSKVPGSAIHPNSGGGAYIDGYGQLGAGNLSIGGVY